MFMAIRKHDLCLTNYLVRYSPCGPGIRQTRCRRQCPVLRPPIPGGRCQTQNQHFPRHHRHRFTRSTLPWPICIRSPQHLHLHLTHRRDPRLLQQESLASRAPASNLHRERWRTRYRRDAPRPGRNSRMLGPRLSGSVPCTGPPGRQDHHRAHVLDDK
jgi:hypothetical protein